MHRRVELRFIFDPRGHQTSSIQHDQNRLVALHLILSRDQPAASRGGCPGNVPHLVATHVIAQRFKLASFAAPLRFAPRRDERAGAQRSQFNFARAPHVGIDLDGDGRIDTRLTPNQSPTGKKTHRYRSEFEASALGRRQFVNQCRARLRLNLDASFARPGEFHLWRIFVFDD